MVTRDLISVKAHQDRGREPCIAFQIPEDSVAWFFCFALRRKHCICRQAGRVNAEPTVL